jgi:geranylgeranyl diphosphate synthase type II
MDLEAALETALARHLEKADGRTPPNLADSIRYSLLAPGKRIRPRLALACAEMVNLPFEAALPAALSIEMIHCFTLIHDDLPCMDDDDMRRGRPSNHKVFGEATALLAGDALMTLALETLMDAAPHVQPENFMRALRRFAWATGPRGVMGGQAAESLLGKDSTLLELRQMHAMKTGALFSAALQICKDLAGIPDLNLPGTLPLGASLDRFASELGLAFQVADDLDDGEAQDEADKPTNILFYISKEEAREDTLKRLMTATSALIAAWTPPIAEPLVRVAGEVSRSLQGGAHS